ncbi:hypothetical protein [Aeoliella sp.]|uniref:hypothetical protein n=1 Tax=Aeoliella sp. TaxID=2795800 RepID=UPI003CCBDCB5
MSNDQSTSNRPVAELRDGLMRIAIFRNEPKEEGDRVRFSGKLTRSYQDAAGNWHDTEYLSSVDYLKAANLMQEAYNTERELRQAERSTAPEQDGPA